MTESQVAESVEIGLAPPVAVRRLAGAGIGDVTDDIAPARAIP